MLNPLAAGGPEVHALSPIDRALRVIECYDLKNFDMNTFTFQLTARYRQPDRPVLVSEGLTPAQAHVLKCVIRCDSDPDRQQAAVIAALQALNTDQEESC